MLNNICSYLNFNLKKSISLLHLLTFNYILSYTFICRYTYKLVNGVMMICQASDVTEDVTGKLKMSIDYSSLN